CDAEIGRVLRSDWVRPGSSGLKVCIRLECLDTSLPGRGQSHSVGGVALLVTSTVRHPHWKTPSAKLHHTAVSADRDDGPAPGIRHTASKQRKALQFEPQLDAPISLITPRRLRLQQLRWLT